MDDRCVLAQSERADDRENRDERHNQSDQHQTDKQGALPDDSVSDPFGCETIDDDEYLEHLIERLEDAGKRGRTKVTIGEILDVIGPRAFAPLLVLVGLLITSPLSGIPLFPTVVGVIVVLTAVQIMCGRSNVWLPRPLLRLAVPKTRLRAALSWLHTPARLIDRYTVPRLQRWVHGASVYIVAIVCMLLAAFMPIMEFVPFSATLAGIMLTTFGVALVAHDGLICVLAYGLMAALVFVLFVVVP